ncbi:MAG: 1,4-alpha-glucan branching protein GlgB [Acidobacteria bacterium]|nr:1,4-alpha-glucan branching protein GlgB [Acidobacteriota bacterium]
MSARSMTRKGEGGGAKRLRPDGQLIDSSPTSVAQPLIPEDELMLLLTRRHKNPHSILGVHLTAQGVVVRALHPGAKSVSLLVEGEPSRQMVEIDESGLFQIVLEERARIFAYRLEVSYPNGRGFTLRDPYAFPPTLGEIDLYLSGEGRHEHIYQKLGSHVRELGGEAGVSFAVWAPSAASVSVVGHFNGWDARLHMMRKLGASGIWEIFIPELKPGAIYKYEIRTLYGATLLKADPYAFRAEIPPLTSSIVYESSYCFNDEEWLDKRTKTDLFSCPISIYEVHIGSWRRVPGEGDRALSYRELAAALADYVEEMGFTHVEFLPLMGYPFGGSWGYQVSSYYAPTPRFGTPDDFRFLVNHLHERGIGVILDWVPAHFPKDAWSLGRFDGTALYEHGSPHEGEHPDWGTYIFNYGRNEVRNFLQANALFWIKEYHLDGLRLDAVASMLYRNYNREPGKWVPNNHGGCENLEAVTLLKELNEIVHDRCPGVRVMAEESTIWAGVSRPTYTGGLGFTYKWDLGWMQDTLAYFSTDPIYRRHRHHNLTSGLLYAWSENFVLPLSHDEVVHGKGSLINKMPGDRWQRFANLRALYAYMWARPGKKLLFMGGEFGQWREWNFDASLDWHLLDAADHLGLKRLVRDLNHCYREEPALWEADTEPSGFQWIAADGADDNLIAFVRKAPAAMRQLVCVCNFSPVTRYSYRLGLPAAGEYREVLNTDAKIYGGTNVRNDNGLRAEPVPSHGQEYSALVILPPLAVLWFRASR